MSIQHPRVSRVRLAMDRRNFRALSRQQIPPGARPAFAHHCRMVDYWVEIVERYPLISLEAGLGTDDWEGWQSLQQRLGDASSSRATYLLVTNIERRRKAIDMRAANLFVVKLNQIGSLTLAPLANEKTYALQAPLVVRSEASLIDH